MFWYRGTRDDFFIATSSPERDTRCYFYRLARGEGDEGTLRVFLINAFIDEKSLAGLTTGQGLCYD